MNGNYEPSFFFYDLETSGIRAREDRIMQFAGQRTDMNLEPIGEPVNILVKMTEEVLPHPQAIMVTGITPQKTLEEGISEAELAKYLYEEIFTPGTIAVGFNSVRFDDEFMRALFWRNFYDPYEWQWKDGRSRWDILDVVRMTRALRPEGINWPTDEEGRATNRLELLTKENGLSHEHAHDALSDVYATIAVAKLIREKQPELFKYLFEMRDKNQVRKLVNLDDPRPFVYVSGRYPGEFNKATVAVPLAEGRNGNVVVYDLRYNVREVDPEESFPIIKELAYNKCPAVAPLGVLTKNGGWEKIGLDAETVKRNLAALKAEPDFLEKVRKARKVKLEEVEKEGKFKAHEPEGALYDGFLNDADRVKVAAVRNAETAEKLADFDPGFDDKRLPELLLHYKGRNFPEALGEAESKKWKKYVKERLERQSEEFVKELSEVYERDEFLGEELKLYFEDVMADSQFDV